MRSCINCTDTSKTWRTITNVCQQIVKRPGGMHSGVTDTPRGLRVVHQVTYIVTSGILPATTTISDTDSCMAAPKPLVTGWTRGTHCMMHLMEAQKWQGACLACSTAQETYAHPATAVEVVSCDSTDQLLGCRCLATARARCTITIMALPCGGLRMGACRVLSTTV